MRAPALLGLMPQSLFLRGLVAGAVGLFILQPLGLGLMALLEVQTVSAAGFVAYNVIHGMALSALILPTLITGTTNARGALNNARDLAGRAESWAYERIWVAEHIICPASLEHFEIAQIRGF